MALVSECHITTIVKWLCAGCHIPLFEVTAQLSEVRLRVRRVRTQAAMALEAKHIAGQSKRGGTVPDHGFI